VGARKTSLELTPLTDRQKAVLSFIERYTNENGMPPTVREIMRTFKFSSTNAVAQYLKVLERKGFIEKRKNTSRGSIPRSRSSATYVPIVGRIAAGKPIYASENLEGNLIIDRFLCKGEDDLFALRVQGDSMIGDGIYDGDLVIVRRQDHAKKGDIVVALMEDEATIKHFELVGENLVRLVPSNPAHKVVEVDPSRIPLRVLGVVVGLFRKY
jgi:repressor LexA